jgi:outer membrane protein
MMSIARTFLLTVGLVGLPLTVVALPSVATAAAAPTVERLAMVDLQRLLTETSHGKRAKKKLENELKSKQQKLDKTRARLEGEVAKLQRMTGAALQKKQEQLQAESTQWQQDAMQFEQDLAQNENQMLEDIYSKAHAIVKKIAKEQGLGLVLIRDQMTVLYVERSLDITEEVIKRYNKAHK